MKAAGYRTGLIGKYLNGTPPLIPKPGGWDTWLQLDEATGYNVVRLPGVRRRDDRRRPSQFQMEYLRDQAMTFIAGLGAVVPVADARPRRTFRSIRIREDLFAWSDVRWPLVIEDDVDDKPSWISGQPPLPPSVALEFPRDARGRNCVKARRSTGRSATSSAASRLRCSTNTVVIYSLGQRARVRRAPIAVRRDIQEHRVRPRMRVPLVIRGPGVSGGRVGRAGHDGRGSDRHHRRHRRRHPQVCRGDGIDLRDMIANPVGVHGASDPALEGCRDSVRRRAGRVTASARSPASCTAIPADLWTRRTGTRRTTSTPTRTS